MKTGILRRTSVFACVFAVFTMCRATTGPDIPSDKLLDGAPVVAVAEWEKAAIGEAVIPKADKNGPGFLPMDQVQFPTTLHVLSVIKGDLKPGEYKILVNGGMIEFEPRNKSSKELDPVRIFGAADDLTKPNIWFLFLDKGVVAKGRARSLAVYAVQDVQPLGLLPYFAALGSPDPGKNALKLLASKDVTLIKQTLQYPFDTPRPWPVSYDIRLGGPMVEVPLRKGIDIAAWAAGVMSVIERKGAGDARPLAVAAYAKLKGAESAPYLRLLLWDRDPEVRTAASEFLNMQTAAAPAQ